ncbi:MAG: S9 family peptidase [Cytophagaceae bacterium]|nr:S9 family peptidase [Cytophagaceae bacterium]
MNPKRNPWLWLAPAALLLLTLRPAPAQTPVKKYTIQQFMNTTRLSGAVFSPDESKLVFNSNQSGTVNAYEVPLTGGTAKPLTTSTTNAIYAEEFLPDGRLLYASDEGGNELTHLFLRQADGPARELTPAKGAKVGFEGMSFDKKSFFYSSNERDKRFFDLYEMDATTLTSKVLFKNEGGYFPGAVSDNKRYLALTKVKTSADADIYLHDFQTGQTKHLTPHPGEVAFSPLSFTPDNRKLLYLSDEGSEFKSLKAYDLQTGKSETLEKAPWDVSFGYFSRMGRYRVTALNQDARTVVKIMDTKTGQDVKLPNLPAGDVVGVTFADSETKMAFYINSSTAPSNLFVYDFTTGKVTQLSQSLNPEIDAADLVAGEVIRYKSFDGMEIPALLYKPKGLKPGEKRPALLVIHGGPGGQTRLNYNPLTQYLVNHGYVLLAVNNRGSSGYGKTFFAADDRKHGDADLKDCVESKKFLTATGYVDPAKIGIMGGSYGGYMTLAGLAFTPNEFAVGVDIFGVANWLRTLKSIPSWWTAQRESLYKELGDPAVDSAALYAKSPLFHASRIKKPLIVLQGANDPRVLQVESDEMVANVRKNGVPVEYIIFPNEGHGFVKKENEIKGYEAILVFLDNYLAGNGATGGGR